MTGTFLRSLIGLALLTSPAFAQSHNGAVIGMVGAGLAAHDNGAFSNRLQSYTPTRANGEELIYQTENFISAGTALNAGLCTMFGRGYVLGLAAERTAYPTVHAVTSPGSPRDDYDLSAIEGGLDLGYAFVNDVSTIVYPFLHTGYCSYSLEYHNQQGVPVPFFEGQPVASGSSATYTGAGARWALGVGLVHFLGSSDGLAIAARLTWGMMVSRAEWAEPDGGTVKNGGLTPGYNGVNLSISIGGGTTW